MPEPIDHLTTLPNFEAVLLDLDGLVLDTEPTYLCAWREAATAFGVVIDDPTGHALFGQHADDVMRALQTLIGPRFDRARFHALAEKHWRAYLKHHGIACMPGLSSLLACFERLNIPYALATNSDAPYVLECLACAGIARCFPVWVSRDQVAHGKPAPDLFVEAARRLGVDPSACLVLEDSATGLLAAHRAEAIPILVQKRQVPAEIRGLAAACFASLAEVANVLDAKRKRVAQGVFSP